MEVVGLRTCGLFIKGRYLKAPLISFFYKRNNFYFSKSLHYKTNNRLKKLAPRTSKPGIRDPGTRTTEPGTQQLNNMRRRRHFLGEKYVPLEKFSI